MKPHFIRASRKALHTVMIFCLLLLSFGLSATPAAQAAFDFSLTNGGAKTVNAGSSVTNTVASTITGTPAGTVYISDTFTGANGATLASHRPEVGGAWTDNQAGIKIQTNQLQGVNFGDVRSSNATIPASANYDVSMDVVWAGPAGSGFKVGVQGRIQGSFTAGYEAYYDTGSSSWVLRRWKGGNPTQLGTFAQAYVQGQTHNVRLSMAGNTIAVLVDGTSRISVSDPSGTSATNKAGIYFGGGYPNTSILADNYIVSDNGATVPAVNFTVSGLPTGATGTFSPAACSPTCNTVLNVTTSTSTPIGTYPITVTGTSGTVVHTTSFNLTVNTAPDTTAPSVPSNLTANASSTTQINLAWTASTDNVGVTGYKIFRNGVQVATSSTNSFSDTGLNPSTTYNYKVSAFDAAGNNSAQSIQVSATTQAVPDTTAPSVPTNLSATAISGSQINLSWSASTDNIAVTGYKVFRNGVQISNPTATNYSDTGLTAGTTYNYTISAFDAAGNESAQSAPTSATTPAPDTTPPTVAITSPQDASTVTGSIAITSTASDNVAVAGVTFKLDGNTLGVEDTTAPYSANLDTTTTSNGSHTLTAIARDSSNNTASASINVTVQNTAPPGPLSLTNSGPQSVVQGSSATNTISAAYTGGSGTGSTYVSDNFTDTAGKDIALHTPNVGGTWINDQAGIKILTNNLEGVNFGDARAHNTAAPASANYEVSADLLVNQTGWGNKAGVRGRDAGGRLGNAYEAYYDQNTNQWKLDKWVGFNSTNLGVYAQSFPLGTTHNVKLGMVGSAITVYVDGVAQISVTDSSITSIGNGGLYISGGIHDGILVDNFLVADSGNVAPTVTFQANNLPAGTTASFAPATCTLNCSTILTLNTTASTPTGTYPITVSGTSGTNTATSIFNLTVSAPPSDTQAPTIPANLTATTVSSSQINLTWTASTDNVAVAGYKIYRNSVQIGTTASTGFADTALAASTSYTYTISAYDAAGNNSAQGTPTSATTFAASSLMALISQGQPAFASSSSTIPANADDTDPASSWTSSTLPAWLAYDLSAVPVSQRQNILVAIYNPATSDYFNATGAGTNIPVNYTIESNAAPTSSTAPATGWTQLLSVTNNNLSSPQHLVNLGGANWIRINITSATSANATVDMDVYSAPAGANDDWLFMGDSITHSTFMRGFSNLQAQVHANDGTRWPAVIEAATGGAQTISAQSIIDGYLANFPGKYVVLAYGTNDNPATFQMDALIQKVLAAGKVPVIPHMPWSDLRLNEGPQINQQIDNLYAQYPQVLRGPDLWATFLNRTDLIPSGDVHPNAAGQIVLRQKWSEVLTSPVNPPADVTAPTVLITAPTNNSTVSGTTSIVASAADNIGVVGVQFKLDGANYGAENTTTPYSISWNSTSATDGTHVWSAVARDAAGNSTTSAPITVNVNNTTPPPPPTGVWTNVTPTNVNLTSSLDCGNYGTQTVVADPLRPSNLYAQFNCQGVWKSTDYGTTWTGPIDTGSAAKGAGGIAIGAGPAGQPPILYAATIRGSSGGAAGFSKSTDGGVTWTTINIPLTGSRQDFYQPSVDPYDSNHLVMNAHEQSIMIQSFDGGQTWSSVTMNAGMSASGTAYTFFINTGNATTTRNTWLYIPQDSGGAVGTWRTSNGGSSWTRVDKNEHPHGESQIFQPDSNGVIFMAGSQSALGWGALRSSDYGQTWTHVGNGGSEAIIFGTPTNVHSMLASACGLTCNSTANYEAAGLPATGTWTYPIATPSGMTQGPASSATVFNGTKYVIVSSNWGAGIWRYIEQ